LGGAPLVALITTLRAPSGPPRLIVAYPREGTRSDPDYAGSDAADAGGGDALLVRRQYGGGLRQMGGR